MGFKPRKIMVIGIDGGDPDLIFNRLRDRLPNISRLISQGISGTALSTIPSATIPAWNSFFTGLNPGGHGMFDFTASPDYYYQIRFINSRLRKAPSIWQTASNAGKKCAVLNFPSCYPPETINGVMISGFDCPLPSGGDRSFINPPELYDEILRRFGPYKISGFDQVSLHPSKMGEAAKSLLQTAEYKGLVAEWLLKKDKWDLFMVHFGEIDAASHHFWRYYDRNSPRNPNNKEDRLAQVIPDIYVKIDEQVGKLVDAINEDWIVLLMSDHGFTGAGVNVLHLNNLLRDNDLLVYNRSSLVNDSTIKQLLRFIPPRLRKYLFRGKLSGITDKVEGLRRYGNINFEKTTVFSDELNYFPSIRVNLKGKYCRGMVSENEISSVLDKTMVVLRGCSDKNGRPVIRSAYRKEELYSAKFLDQAPDLILEMNTPEGYINGVLPSRINGPAVRELTFSEYPGGKGSFPCGGHRREGFYIINNYHQNKLNGKTIQIFDLTEVLYYILIY